MSSHRADTSSDRGSRTSRAVRLGAVLLALVGVSAAATSAGFTDGAWFTGSAAAGTVELQGSLDGKNWQDADSQDQGIAIQIPAETFDNMVPGDKRTVTVHLHNDSTVPVIVSKELLASGPLLADNETTKTLEFAKGAGAQTVELAANDATNDQDDTTATLTITAGDWAEDLEASQASANTLSLHFTAQAVPTVSGN